MRNSCGQVRACRFCGTLEEAAGPFIRSQIFPNHPDTHIFGTDTSDLASCTPNLESSTGLGPENFCVFYLFRTCAWTPA